MQFLIDEKIHFIAYTKTMLLQNENHLQMISIYGAIKSPKIETHDIVHQFLFR